MALNAVSSAYRSLYRQGKMTKHYPYYGKCEQCSKPLDKVESKYGGGLCFDCRDKNDDKAMSDFNHKYGCIHPLTWS